MSDPTTSELLERICDAYDQDFALPLDEAVDDARAHLEHLPAPSDPTVSEMETVEPKHDLAGWYEEGASMMVSYLEGMRDRGAKLDPADCLREVALYFPYPGQMKDNRYSGADMAPPSSDRREPDWIGCECGHEATTHAVDDEELRECMDRGCGCVEFTLAPAHEQREPDLWICTTCCRLALHSLDVDDDTCAECTQPLVPAYRSAPPGMEEAVREALDETGAAGDPWVRLGLIEEILTRAMKATEGEQ